MADGNERKLAERNVYMTDSGGVEVQLPGGNSIEYPGGRFNVTEAAVLKVYEATGQKTYYSPSGWLSVTKT